MGQKTPEINDMHKSSFSKAVTPQPLTVSHSEVRILIFFSSKHGKNPQKYFIFKQVQESFVYFFSFTLLFIYNSYILKRTTHALLIVSLILKTKNSGSLIASNHRISPWNLSDYCLKFQQYLLNTQMSRRVTWYRSYM